MIDNVIRCPTLADEYNDRFIESWAQVKNQPVKGLESRIVLKSVNCIDDVLELGVDAKNLLQFIGSVVSTGAPARP